MESASATRKPIFWNVAKPHTYDAPPPEVLCEECGNVLEHPLRVFTCAHKLCAACWQRSAYNFYGHRNECIVCKVPTELVCYRDYWKFIAINLLSSKCWVGFHKNLDLEKLTMQCSVEGCTFKDLRPKVIEHERACWGDYRLKKYAQKDSIACTSSPSKSPKHQ